MSYSNVRRVFIVQYYLHSKSYLKCQNDFRNAFPKSQVLRKSKVFRLVAAFLVTGSVSDREPSGRPVVFNDVSVEDIRHSLVQSPRKFQL
jgi:hypothetical protein